MSDKSPTGHFGSSTGAHLPLDQSQLGHIFGDRSGHLPDTPANRLYLVEVANSGENFIGRDSRGLDWYAVMEDDGTQTWVAVRNGVIQNGGRNRIPNLWNRRTGLSKNPFN